MQSRAEITVEAVKEALEFIEDNWGTWEGDIHMLMANVISDERVTTYDVRRLIRALSEGEPVEGLESLTAQKIGSSYTINVNR